MEELQLRPRGQENMRGFSLLELMMVSTVMVVVLSIISGIVQSVNGSYTRQRPRMEAVTNASAALDTIVRIVRLSGANPNSIANFPSVGTPAIVPAANSIRIRADWNPSDGDLTDPYENVEFTVSNGVLRKQDPSDASPVPLLENIESLAFTYRDINGATTTSGNSVALLDITLVTRTPDSLSEMTFSSSVSVRRLER